MKQRLIGLMMVRLIIMASLTPVNCQLSTPKTWIKNIFPPVPFTVSYCVTSVVILYQQCPIFVSFLCHLSQVCQLGKKKKHLLFNQCFRLGVPLFYWRGHYIFPLSGFFVFIQWRCHRWGRLLPTHPSSWCIRSCRSRRFSSDVPGSSPYRCGTRSG